MVKHQQHKKEETHKEKEVHKEAHKDPSCCKDPCCDSVNGVKVGMALGYLTAGCMGLLALLSMMLGVGTALVHMLGTIFLGYAATPLGLLIGLGWGYVKGFLGGFLFCLLYNKLNNGSCCK